MLRVAKECKERFKAAKAEAKRVGLVQQFAKVLRWLNSYACFEDRPMTRVTLYHDFAPHSFSIVWERRKSDGTWEDWFIGGLIYHGPHDNGGDGSFPTLSVNLSPHYGWSAHT